MKTSVCRYCGGPVRYIADRFAWVHVHPGADHAPIPSKP